jgi:hypothetical protein
MRGKSALVKEPKRLEADECLPDGSHYYLVNWGGDELCPERSWQHASVVEDRAHLIGDFLISTKIAKIDEATQTSDTFWASPAGICSSKQDLFKGFSCPPEKEKGDSNRPVLLADDLLPWKVLEYCPEKNVFKVLMCGQADPFSVEGSVLLRLNPGLAADYFLDASRTGEEELT